MLSAVGGGFFAAMEGGGNCNTLSIGGGFLGAKAFTTLGFLVALDVGGAGKSELDSDG